jgi:hypothetical protein
VKRRTAATGASRSRSKRSGKGIERRARAKASRLASDQIQSRYFRDADRDRREREERGDDDVEEPGRLEEADLEVHALYVSDYGIAAKLEAKYDQAYCTGIRRYGSQALNTAQWGWVRGYWQFECSYDTLDRQCYGGRFETLVNRTNGRWGHWYTHMLSRGRCYSL